uniref:Uncharacterized protein n=1 Tax=Anguilla anguilla TaxID=7936 RepID=A0A0E9TWS4_ANGAN
MSAFLDLTKECCKLFT